LAGEKGIASWESGSSLTPWNELEPATMQSLTTCPRSHVEAGGAAVVRLTETEFHESNVGLTGKRLVRLAEQVGPRGIELDLAAVGFLTTTGLGELVSLHHRVAAAGGRLTLTRVCSPVFEVFEVTRLTKLLDVQRADAA
jgi:anti-anti-sigma factor